MADGVDTDLTVKPLEVEMDGIRRHNFYRVSTEQGGSLDTIAVDVRYDTLEERRHRAWCKLLEDKFSPEYKMAMALMAELGISETKALFEKALVF